MIGFTWPREKRKTHKLVWGWGEGEGVRLWGRECEGDGEGKEKTLKPASQPASHPHPHPKHNLSYILQIDIVLLSFSLIKFDRLLTNIFFKFHV